MKKTNNPNRIWAKRVSKEQFTKEENQMLTDKKKKMSKLISTQGNSN